MTIDPTPYTSSVELCLATSGRIVDVFDEWAVDLDMLSAGSPFSFRFWRSDPITGSTTASRTSTWEVLAREVKCFDNVIVMIDDAAQLSGRIEVRNVSASRQEGAFVLTNGRDLAGVAMDWDTDPTLTIRNMQLGEALPQIFGTLGLPCRVVDSIAAVQVNAHEAPGPRRTQRRASRRTVVDIAHPKPGEKVWAFAESIVRRLGYLMWVAPDAEHGLSVVVDVPNNSAEPSYVLLRRAVTNATGAFEGNILSGGESINTRNAPTAVTIYSGTDRGNRISARGRSTTTNVAILDDVVTRGLVLADVPPQPRHIRSTRARTPQRAAQEGSNVIVEAMRSFRTYECTVQGFGQTTDGAKRLYAINTVARVRDDICLDSQGRPLDEDMLIVGVKFKGSHSAGTTTTLTLVPKGSLALVPTED